MSALCLLLAALFIIRGPDIQQELDRPRLIDFLVWFGALTLLFCAAVQLGGAR